MPEYTITDRRTGRTIRRQFASQPTETEAEALFAEPRSLTERAVEDFGLAETAGGLVGGAVGSFFGGAGAIPGAMLGAGAVRAVRGRLKGERPEDTALAALGSAGLEAIPVVGKVARGFGRRLIRSALPITADVAKQAGRGLKHRGVQRILEQAEALPGVRLKTTERFIGEAPTTGGAPGRGRLGALAEARERVVREAEQRGVRIPVEPTVRETSTELLGRTGRLRGPPHKAAAKSTIRRFAEDVTTERMMPPAELQAAMRSGLTRQPGFQPTMRELLPLKPTEINDILRNMRFESGAAHLPGTVTASRGLRRRLSGELKRVIPAAEPIFAEQQRLIPLQKVIDEALASGRQLGPRAPSVYLSGGRPRLFGVIAPSPATAYATGKAFSRVGGPLGAAPTAQRILPGSIRALLNRLLLQQEGLEE